MHRSLLRAFAVCTADYDATLAVTARAWRRTANGASWAPSSGSIIVIRRQPWSGAAHRPSGQALNRDNAQPRMQTGTGK